jgi:hypothetical protein
LYCSTYPELNDPFEGIFATTLYHLHLFNPREARDEDIPSRPTGTGRRGILIRLAKRLRRKIYAYKKVEDLFGGEIDKIKICSLSADLKDVRLWSYYTDGHRGIVFEIDFSGLEERNGSKIIHPVTYSEKLPWGLLPDEKITLLGEPLKPQDVLSRKTKHWEFESEYRIIDESEYLEESKYFGIKDRIKAIYLGTRTSDKYRELLKKLVQGKIPIWTTKINHEKIIVEPDKLIEG